MLPFQAYQHAFTAHLRDPKHHDKPDGVNDQRMRIYREIVFNNFLASVRACFPVLSQLLGKRRFGKLVRACFYAQPFESPLFADIPKTFVDYLQTGTLPNLDIPAFAAQLAHYEWVELAVSRQVETHHDATNRTQIAASDALRPCVLQLPAVHRLLHYDYPVQSISKKNAHPTPEATFLLVYRTPDYQVRFIQLNAITFQLLQQLQANTVSAMDHLTTLAHSLPHLPAASIIEFGLQTLHTLHQQQALCVKSPYPLLQTLPL